MSVVPQCSILSPFIFDLYLADLQDHILRQCLTDYLSEVNAFLEFLQKPEREKKQPLLI